MASPSPPSFPSSGARLVELLLRTPELQAVELDGRRGSLSYATLGTEKRGDMEARLNEAVKGVDLAFERGCGEGAAPAGPIEVGQDDGVARYAKPACETAARFWRWRSLPLPQARAPSREEAASDAQEKPKEADDWRWLMLLAGLCGAAGSAAFALERMATGAAWLVPALYGASLLLGGWDAAIDTWRNLRRRSLDIHFLMLAVAAGAASIGAAGEAALLLFLFSFAGSLEAYAFNRTRREIQSLFDLAPRRATRLEADGHERSVPVEALQPGDRLRVRPGDLFPVDLIIEEGETETDDSNLTGESMPAPKTKGDSVLGGSLNLWGTVAGRVERPASESSLQRIIKLVEQAQRAKAPSQRFTDKFGTRYTVLILGATAGVFLFWWAGMGAPAFRVPQDGAASAFYRAMTFLVVASPCALALSIPSAILAAIAWGARRGILFRGGAAVERLSEVDTVALDKTGTITAGAFEVASVASYPPGREEAVAALAYSLERGSAHPIAKAIRKRGEQIGCQDKPVEGFRSLNGHGLRARCDGKECFLGRRDLLLEKGAQGALAREVPEAAPAESEVWLASGDLIGRLLLRDAPREAAKATLERLRALGLRLLMLTGDRRAAALAMGETVGLTQGEVKAGLLPEDKEAEIRRLKREGRRVAMVGDGVNDGPSLAAADIAVAMGAHGSDTAMEQSHVVLVDDRIEKFVSALLLSRQARRIIRQNLAIALGAVGVMGLLSAAGLTSLSLGVLAHEGSTVVVCLNSLRLLFFREQPKPTG